MSISSMKAPTPRFGRSIIEMDEPRHRLDSGSWGVMGIGTGYAVGAARQDDPAEIIGARRVAKVQFSLFNRRSITMLQVIDASGNRRC